MSRRSSSVRVRLGFGVFEGPEALGIDEDANGSMRGILWSGGIATVLYME